MVFKTAFLFSTPIRFASSPYSLAYFLFNNFFNFLVPCFVWTAQALAKVNFSPKLRKKKIFLAKNGYTFFQHPVFSNVLGPWRKATKYPSTTRLCAVKPNGMLLLLQAPAQQNSEWEILQKNGLYLPNELKFISLVCIVVEILMIEYAQKFLWKIQKKVSKRPKGAFLARKTLQKFGYRVRDKCERVFRFYAAAASSSYLVKRKLLRQKFEYNLLGQKGALVFEPPPLP